MGATGLERFEALPDADCERELLSCCAAPAWAAAVRAGRPYGSVQQLLDRADGLLADATAGDVEAALAAHPRIGQRAAGDTREAGWSRREQAGAQDPARAAELAEGNAAYEERFDRVFLIRATGRDAGEVLAELRRRLGNEPVAEDAEVRRELRGITALRLRALVEP